ncbi:MAG: type VI secretion system membrane subunit TssM [bacterium]
MTWLINTLKNQRVMIAIGFILLILLLVIVGWVREWTRAEVLLSVMLVIFAWVLLLMYEQMQAARRASSIEQSLRAHGEEQIRGLRPDKRADIERFQKELVAAIESLKRSKLGRGRSGKSALYALPWYMMIGPSGGGKTTAILNSGLEFPYRDENNNIRSLQGVGGTRNCEWFLSSAAILLDTAGRYISEEDDREEWLAFLDTLKKHRRKMPINGVLVGMAMDDLLNANAEEIEWHAQTIRRRIDELMLRLGIRFPVYLVFTKSDLLDGFVEYFEGLSRREREQIWGCTYTEEEMKSANAAAVFEQEFDTLLNTLNNTRLAHLSQPLKREQRRKVFMFPLQLATVKEKLVYFVGKLFQANPYQENPVMRGYYFTSATQEGVPIDRAIEAIAREFGLAPLSTSGEGAATERKHYFIKDLFTEVIIPDQNFLVRKTSRAADTARLMRLGLIAGAVVALALFIMGVTFDYVRSKSQMQWLSEAGPLVAEVDWRNAGLLASNLDRLEQFRARMDSLQRYDDSFSLVRFGMSRNATVLESARQLYSRKMKGFVDEYIYDELVQRLRQYGVGSGLSRDQIYTHLKAYLLLGDESARLEADTSNYGFLAQELDNIAISRLKTLISQEQTANHFAASAAHVALLRHIQFFVRNLRKKGAPAFQQNDPRLVARVRGLINEPVTPITVYRNLKSRGVNSAQAYDVTLNRILRGEHTELLLSNQTVSGLFTQEGWKTIAEELIEKESKNPDKDDWVLGKRQVQMSAAVSDPKRLKEELVRLYFEDYAQNWWQFLRSIQYAGFADLRTANESLELLGDAQKSPLKAILETAKQETGVDPNLLNQGVGWLQTRFKLPNALETHASSYTIDASFDQMHIFVAGAGNAPNELSGALGLLFGVAAELEQVATEASGMKAKDCAVKVVAEAGALPQALIELRKMWRNKGGESRPVLVNLFETPLRLVWGTILGQSYNYLNTEWRSRVYAEFGRLAPYYPFNNNGADASPKDVADFFSSQGPLWKFADQELKPFFRLDNFSQPLLWEGQGLALSSRTQEAFRRARDLGTALGSGTVSFEVQMQPAKFKSPNDQDAFDKIRLMIGGRELDFRRDNPPKWEGYTWPGNQASRGGTISILDERRFQPDEEVGKVGFEREWGWFRLLNAGKSTRINNVEYQYQWALTTKRRNELLVTFVLRASSGVNPFASRLLNFDCPQQLN